MTSKLYKILIISAILIFPIMIARAEFVTMKHSKVRILIPKNWTFDYDDDDEMIVTPPDSDLKVIFVGTSFKSLDEAFRDASLGFEKITEKREFQINGMPAILFRANDIIDVNGEYKTFKWFYVLFRAGNGYICNMCCGADERSDVFFKYYIDLNMIYKTLKPTDASSGLKGSRSHSTKKSSK